jgi:hypothetical protein
MAIHVTWPEEQVGRGQNSMGANGYPQKFFDDAPEV